MEKYQTRKNLERSSISKMGPNQTISDRIKTKRPKRPFVAGPTRKIQRNSRRQFCMFVMSRFK
jgi:hypothetical protein